ncbi:MAG: hypothetical protein NC355_02190 [Blautia sp.]|nr:hypothetical protein [Blautia sp.]
MGKRMRNIRIEKNDNTEKLLHGYGYHISVQRRDSHKYLLKFIPDYQEMMIYPTIKYFPASREFVAHMPEALPLHAKDKEMWMKGISNIFDMLQELNENISELLPENAECFLL